MTLKEWVQKFKDSGIDVHGHEELFLDLEDIIKDHDIRETEIEGYKTSIKDKDTEIQDLKDKCFRLFERQTNWDNKAEQEINAPETKDPEEPKPFSFDDMYEITD